MKAILIPLMCFTLFSGCAISPLSPRMDQRIDNTEGQIEDIRSNQNGLMLEIGKLRQQQDISARDIESAQQGIINLRGSNYSGVQIFSGDGGVILFFSLATFSIFLIYHYRTRAVKSEKTAEILAQSIAMQEDTALDNRVFMSALNTEVESDVYHTMVKQQALVGRKL